MRHSVCQSVIHPFDNDTALGVILLANKIDRYVASIPSHIFPILTNVVAYINQDVS